MSHLLLLKSMLAVCVLCVGVIGTIWRRGQVREFGFLVSLIAVLGIEEAGSILTLFFRAQLGLTKMTAYNLYLYSHVISFFVEYGLLLLVIYSVFRKAMSPLDGLHRAGKIVFRWVCGVSLALVLGMSLSPHMTTGTYLTNVTGQVQQGISVLILCLLLFVCFSTRYLGLTYRSRIFGVSLGLGVYAAASLVESAWYATSGAHSLYSPLYIFSALSVCVTLLTWGTYFAMPEPERKMILLPTTSPFFLWNRISEALGDDPGFVAIAGFKPEMMAPAELTVITAATKQARERDARAARETESAAQSVMAMPRVAMPR